MLVAMDKFRETDCRRRRPRLGFRRVLFCLFALICGTCPAAIESVPVNVDEIRWRKFRAPSSEVYIDTKIQFTPAFCSVQNVDPKKDKLALWLNVDTAGGRASTNLCVYASRADLAAAPASQSGVVFGARRAVTETRPAVFRLRDTSSLVPGTWHRVTVRTIGDVTRRAARTRNPARGLLGFQIYLDGNLLFSDTPSFSPNYLAFATGSEGWLDKRRDADWIGFLGSGAVFASLCGESADKSVGSVGFQGDGEVSDVDVSSAAPQLPRLSPLDFLLVLPPDESVLDGVVGH